MQEEAASYLGQWLATSYFPLIRWSRASRRELPRATPEVTKRGSGMQEEIYFFQELGTRRDMGRLLSLLVARRLRPPPGKEVKHESR